MQGQDKPRKTEQSIPGRVENAAQFMHASSGYRRGYIPDVRVQNGPEKNISHQNVQRNGMQQASAGTDPRQQAYQQNYAFQQQTTGAQRGYRIPPAPPAEHKPAKKHRGLLAFLVFVLIAGLGTGGYFAYVKYDHQRTIQEKISPYNDKFCPGVYVDGISLGGMTPEQAMNSVQSQIQQRHDAWSVRLVYNGNELALINSDMLGLSVDPSSVMNDAWKQGHSGDEEQRYEQMLLLEQEPYYAYTAKPDGNTQTIDETLESVRQQIDKPATDAAFVTFDPSLDYPFVLSDEAYGYRLDIEPLKTSLYRMVSTLESGEVELQPERILPTVTKAELMKQYSQRCSVYTPIDKHSPEDRNKNIQRAFDYVNGYVLNPGKTFSFNGVVGERTEARGFYPAIEYVYGEHVEGYGGGVCQASTTLYQAAVCAGLQILKREPHSDSVSYAPYGMDATVYWNGKRKIDFSFKNNTEDPIYIIAAVEPDPSNKKRKIARVTIYGRDLGDIRYEMEAETIETLPAPFEPEYVKDTNGTYVTYKDQQQSVSKAKEGYIVKSYRVAYNGSVETERKLLYTDTYEPKPEKIYVGVKSR